MNTAEIIIPFAGNIAIFFSKKLQQNLEKNMNIMSKETNLERNYKLRPPEKNGGKGEREERSLALIVFKKEKRK